MKAVHTLSLAIAVLCCSAFLRAQEIPKLSKFEVGTQFTFVALRQGNLVSNEADISDLIILQNNFLDS